MKAIWLTCLALIGWSQWIPRPLDYLEFQDRGRIIGFLKPNRGVTPTRTVLFGYSFSNSGDPFHYISLRFDGQDSAGLSLALCDVYLSDRAAAALKAGVHANALTDHAVYFAGAYALDELKTECDGKWRPIRLPPPPTVYPFQLGIGIPDIDVILEGADSRLSARVK